MSAVMFFLMLYVSFMPVHSAGAKSHPMNQPSIIIVG